MSNGVVSCGACSGVICVADIFCRYCGARVEARGADARLIAEWDCAVIGMRLIREGAREGIDLSVRVAQGGRDLVVASGAEFCGAFGLDECLVLTLRRGNAWMPRAASARVVKEINERAANLNP